MVREKVGVNMNKHHFFWRDCFSVNWICCSILTNKYKSPCIFNSDTSYIVAVEAIDSI